MYTVAVLLLYNVFNTSNGFIRRRINAQLRPHKSPIATVKRESWHDTAMVHAMTPLLRQSVTLGGSRCRVRPRKTWMDNKREWTDHDVQTLL